MNDIGSYDFEATLPFLERSFNESDWLTTKCGEIAENILEEGSHFVSFTK